MLTTTTGQTVNTTMGGECDSTVSRQWASRPDDERFTSLTDLHWHVETIRQNSKAGVYANRQLRAIPSGTGIHDLEIVGPSGKPVTATHWAFGQLATLAGAPAGYLRSLPSAITADLINYGLHHHRDVEDVGALLTRTPDGIQLRAATGPSYGRVWNSDITSRLVDRFGDGLSGDFKVPGEFGVRVPVTKQNTTLFASDRDFFVFLADEENRIEIPNRRDGRSGSLARGFYISNSETGAGTLTFGAMLFDFACMNRNLWGVNQKTELKIRHTKGAPHKLTEQLLPMLDAYARQNKDQLNRMEEMVLAAQAKKLDNVQAFLSARFSKSQAAAIDTVHMAEEGRPIESLWDASVGVTAYARGIRWQDERVEMEREGGRILDMAA